MSSDKYQCYVTILHIHFLDSLLRVTVNLMSWFLKMFIHDLVLCGASEEEVLELLTSYELLSHPYLPTYQISHLTKITLDILRQ